MKEIQKIFKKKDLNKDFWLQYFEIFENSAKKEIKKKKTINKLHERCNKSHSVLFKFLQIIIDNVEKIQSKIFKQKDSLLIENETFLKKTSELKKSLVLQKKFPKMFEEYKEKKEFFFVGFSMKFREEEIIIFAKGKNSSFLSKKGHQNWK